MVHISRSIQKPPARDVSILWVAEQHGAGISSLSVLRWDPFALENLLNFRFGNGAGKLYPSTTAISVMSLRDFVYFTDDAAGY